MKVLVVGMGFIGTALTNHLQTQGHHLTTIDRHPNNRLSHYCLDAKNLSHLTTAFGFDKYDAVVHLAADKIGACAENNPTQSLNTNMCSLYNVHELVEHYKIPKLIFISSTSVQAPVLSTYAYTKLACEKLLRFKSTKHLNINVVRLSNVYGWGQSPTSNHESLITKSLRCGLEDKPLKLIDRTAQRDYIHIDDVVDGLSKIIELTADSKTYEIGTSVKHTNQEAISLVSTNLKNINKNLRIDYELSNVDPINCTSADITKLKELYPSWNPLMLNDGINRMLEQLQAKT